MDHELGEDYVVTRMVYRKERKSQGFLGSLSECLSQMEA